MKKNPVFPRESFISKIFYSIILPIVCLIALGFLINYIKHTSKSRTVMSGFFIFYASKSILGTKIIPQIMSVRKTAISTAPAAISLVSLAYG